MFQLCIAFCACTSWKRQSLHSPYGLEIPGLASVIRSQPSYNLTYMNPGKENRGDAIGFRAAKTDVTKPLSTSHSPLDFKAKL